MLRLFDKRNDLLLLYLALGFAGVVIFCGIFEAETGYFPWENPETATRGWRFRNKPILFVHFHKAAGSTICNLARLNNEKMLATSSVHNCNIEGDGTKGMISSLLRSSRRLS